jgi:hypothetical protein|tara:strand:+ start:22399 stop:24000 length:1602 start_codon:yes stop_codon:yes gene_type:complete
MKDHKYTTIFSSEIKPLVSEEKDKYLAMASLVEIGDFVPEIDTGKNVDLLPVAFNACVINRANKNGDVVDTATSLAMYKDFINKPINIEHNRDRVVGVILAAGFSEFGTDKALTEDQVKDSKSPFNITLGGVIWKVVNSRLSAIIENASDPTSEDYLKISASWELGFSEYNIMVSSNGEKNIENAEIIADVEKLEELKTSLKGFGGTGVLDDGSGVYRQVINDVVPLGIGLTENPAAEVSGVAIRLAQKSDDIKNQNKSTKIEENSSQLEEKNVTDHKELIVMEKITDIKQITDESLKAGEVQASVITDFIENKLHEASEQFVTEKNEVSDKLKAAQDSHSEMTTEFEAVRKELNEVKEAQAIKAAEDLFNQRMSAFDEEYELDDQHRAIIASDIVEMTEEDFEAYADKMEVLLSRQKYGGNEGDTPDADRKKKGHYGPGQKKKETADEEGEEDFKTFINRKKKEKAAKASEEVEEVSASVEETQEAASVLDEALKNAQVDSSQMPATSEASEATLAEKYQQAFNLDKFEIDY